MTSKELKILTSDFNDIKVLLEKRDNIKRDNNKIRRRLRTQFNKYSFLKDMVDIDCASDRLVNAIVKYFKTLGFDKVENVDKKYKEEDIRLWTDSRFIIMEITGIDTANPKDDKAHRISKYIPMRQSENPQLKVSGVFIVNHDNKKHFSKREKKPFRKTLNDIGISHKYSLTTTVDLLNAFMNIKMGFMTKEDLIEKICSSGELKILGLGGKVSKNKAESLQ